MEGERLRVAVASRVNDVSLILFFFFFSSLLASTYIHCSVPFGGPRSSADVWFAFRSHRAGGKEGEESVNSDSVPALLFSPSQNPP